MGSPTKKHKTRRVAKLAKAGKFRKNKNLRFGTTAPDLSLDKPNANEAAQAKARAALRAKA